MYISAITSIKNYRNLENVGVTFNSCMNFIVGQNNVGKTNLIELLNCLINIGKFSETDFNEITNPIEIEFTVRYAEEEVGYFEDNFDIDDGLSISIKAIQNTVDDRIEYHHLDSEVLIPQRKIKGFNFIYYASSRIPNKELNFVSNFGTGKVLNFLMKKSYAAQNIDDQDLVKLNEVNLVVNSFNAMIGKLHGLSGDKIEAFIDQDSESVINRILQIGDSSQRGLNHLGDGLQHAFNIYLNVLDLLVHLKTTTKDDSFEKLSVTYPDGKKLIPLIVCLDEPEIHQHPYRQRALVKSLRRIIKNENPEFATLLKELFDIDGFIGQVFVVTHSPNVLLNDYQEIIRMQATENTVIATSGMNITFSDDKTHKHLLKSFIYIKEAMFSRSVILVEGDTEFGAIPIFAEKLGFDIDDESIGVIKLDGAESVKRCLNLYRAFGIPANAIIDQDQQAKYDGTPNVSFTVKTDFEAEIYPSLTLTGYISYLDEIGGINRIISGIKRVIPAFDVPTFLANPTEHVFDEAQSIEIMADIEARELVALGNEKNALNGKIIAACVSTVPTSFETVIRTAVGR